MDGPPPPPAGFGLPDENHNVAIIAGSAVTTAIALIVVSLRLYVRSRIVGSVGGDDWWILGSVVCTRNTFLEREILILDRPFPSLASRSLFQKSNTVPVAICSTSFKI